MNLSETGSDVVKLVANSAPPATAYAFTLQWWMGVLTILWIVVQGAFLLRKWYLLEKDRREGRK